MPEEHRYSTDEAGLIRNLDDLLAHARFTAVLDTIGELKTAGALTALLETPVTLARCRALLGLGRWKEAAEVAEKNIEGMNATRTVGEGAGTTTLLIIRPLEVVAAVQALNLAYNDYYAAVADYDRAQFRLYRALGRPASALSCPSE